MRTNGLQFIGVIALVLWASGATSQSRAEVTSSLAFVTEYIRELAANENTRANIEKELKASNSEIAKLSTSIHGSTRIKLELNSQIIALKSMRLNSPFNDLIPNIIFWYERKIELHQQIINITTILLAGPRPDVDYGKVAAEMPKIRAQINYIDETLFKCTPLIFATLIDQKPDSKNHLSHLVITKKEREKLIQDLTAAFGRKLEGKEQNYIVSSASVLKAYLTKNYKCSDEPWD
jgi:hypothetical protein